MIVKEVGHESDTQCDSIYLKFKDRQERPMMAEVRTERTLEGGDWEGAGGAGVKFYIFILRVVPLAKHGRKVTGLPTSEVCTSWYITYTFI